MVLLSVAIVLFSILVSLNAYMHAVLHAVWDLYVGRSAEISNEERWRLLLLAYCNCGESNSVVSVLYLWTVIVGIINGHSISKVTGALLEIASKTVGYKKKEKSCSSPSPTQTFSSQYYELKKMSAFFLFCYIFTTACVAKRDNAMSQIDKSYARNCIIIYK